jgi:hypothetical protein
MSSSQKPRILQPPQQAEEGQQQPSASGEAKGPTGAKQEIGEGSYEGTRDYNRRTAEYLKKGHVEADAQAAKPQSEQEARDMQRAEDEGRSHSKGEH